MTLTVTQADVRIPPVLIETGGLPVVGSAAAGALTGVVQRRTDGVIWRTVRGGIDMAIDGSGDLADLLDYEFRPGVQNDYRAGVMQQIAALFGSNATDSWPTADTGHTWDASNAAFDASGGVGTIVHASANTEFRTYIQSPTDLGDGTYSVTISTGVGGALTGNYGAAGVHAHRANADNLYAALVILNVGSAAQLVLRHRNATVNTDATVGLPFTYNGTQTIRLDFDVRGNRIRARAWVPASEPRPDWQNTVNVPAGKRITSGQTGLTSYRSTGNTNSNLTFQFDDFVVDTGTPTFLAGLTDDITPGLTGFYLASTMRSFLNCMPLVVGFDEPARESRGGAAYVAGRTLPIASVELAGARTWTLTLRVPTLESARRLEYVIASGDVFYLQVPANCPIPAGYYRVASMASERVIPRGSVRLFELPLTECAAPGPDVKTASATWNSVIAQYGTWTDVVAAQPTWGDLLDLVGDPSEVIVE
jgi:hypothetical protein